MNVLRQATCERECDGCFDAIHPGSFYRIDDQGEILCNECFDEDGIWTWCR